MEIASWLRWDRNAIFNQVIGYFNSENLNDSFTGGCYVITMVFKLINDSENAHSRKVEENILKISTTIDERDWYYFYRILPKEEGITFGLEVYGTFKKM